MQVVVFIAIPIVVGMILLGVSLGKKADAAWKEAARDLKGRYHKPSLGKRHITGSVDGYSITVSTVVVKKGSSSNKFTRYELRFRKRGLGYEIRRAGALSGVAKFFGSQDIEVGEQDFDRAVIIKGTRAQRIRGFLDPERQKAILQVLLTHPGAVVEDGQVYWNQRGISRSAAQIVGVAKRFGRLAQAMSDVGVEDEHEDLSFKSTGRDREEPAEKKRASVAEILAASGIVPASLLGARASGNARAPDNVRTSGDVHRREVESEPAAEPDWLRAAEGLAPIHPVSEPAPLPTEKPPTGTVPWHPPEPEPVPEPEPEPEPEPAAPVPEPERTHASPAAPPATPETSLHVDDVCEDLFAEGLNMIAATKLFDDHYLGQEVEWSGRLERVESYYSDFVFGSGPGAKALFVVYEAEVGSFSSDRVEVMLQLAEGMDEVLRDRLGETIAFAGQLRRLEGYSKRIHVAEGECLDRVG